MEYTRYAMSEFIDYSSSYDFWAHEHHYSYLMAKWWLANSKLQVKLAGRVRAERNACEYQFRQRLAFQSLVEMRT